MDTITRTVGARPGRHQAGPLPTADQDYVREMRRRLRLMSAPRHRLQGPAIGFSTTPATLARLRSDVR